MLNALFTGIALVISTLSTSICDISASINIHEPKARTMRITGYVPNGKKGALNKPVVAGRTAAVSRNCSYLLGEDVYVEGHGVWHVNDLTADWVGKKFKVCTLDLAVPTESHAKKIGNKHKQVTRIGNKDANRRTTKRSR